MYLVVSISTAISITAWPVDCDGTPMYGERQGMTRPAEDSSSSFVFFLQRRLLLLSSLLPASVVVPRLLQCFVYSLLFVI